MARSTAGARGAKPLEHNLLLTATLCLLATGAVMVYSASSGRAVLAAGGGDGTGYLMRYLLYGAIGLAVMHVLARRGLDAVLRATGPLLALSFALLVAVKLPGLGVTVNGAQRWIGSGPLRFQPSELAKIALLLHAVRFVAEKPRRVREPRLLVPLLAVAGMVCLLIVLEPDLGTALVIGATLACVLVAAGMPVRYLLIALGACVVLVLLVAVAEPYRRARLTAFLDPWANASSSGFQAVQGQIALGSGGVVGVGLGESVQKIFYLPEAHTDFILAVIGEELGLAGVGAVLSLYGLIAYSGFRIAQRARGSYAQLLAAGITALILSQAVLNVFTVLGLAPLTGVPLPLISYGSTNLLVLLAGIGLLLNVADGGRVRLRVVEGSRGARGDRSRGDGGARGARAGGRRRAAG
ncbi:MAG TPA: putative lipid II flippase FtsW [Solirubrobacteraceae bacterium]|jgi:cell division protein FtsW|nr:putative lipid II flippase FtsW [Solirubrobacteraceae bacterium]